MSETSPTRDEFQSLYMHVQSLSDTVEDLEKENRDLKNNLEDVRVARDELESALRRISTLEDDVESVSRTMDSIQRHVSALDEDTDDLEDEIETLEQELNDGRIAVETKISDANRRLTGIENYLDIDEVDIGPAIHKDASELEHLASLPARVRESEIDTKPTRRAVNIYEKFDTWAEYTPRGYVITSSDLRKYLNEDLEWTPLYRAMEAFAKKTDGEYAYIDHPKLGKALIRYHPKHRD